MSEKVKNIFYDVASWVKLSNLAQGCFSKALLEVVEAALCRLLRHARVCLAVAPNRERKNMALPWQRYFNFFFPCKFLCRYYHEPHDMARPSNEP